MPMSTSVRHNRLTCSFFSEIIDMLKKKEINALQEECALVYWGARLKPEPVFLVDINTVDNIGFFKDNTIDDLEYILPDFLVFHKNAYVENRRRTRTAGCPDLIVEIWSDGNTVDEKTFKFNLYSASSVTEHWYIEQDANEVACYLGKQALAVQSIKNVLYTTNGLKFDLRYLAM